jgi:hypothetical protein
LLDAVETTDPAVMPIAVHDDPFVDFIGVKPSKIATRSRSAGKLYSFVERLARTAAPQPPESLNT